jgi:hypothetical protein
VRSCLKNEQKRKKERKEEEEEVVMKEVEKLRKKRKSHWKSLIKDNKKIPKYLGIYQHIFLKATVYSFKIL